MKLSVSLPDEDIEFLDAYARSHGYGSRSAALRRAITLLRVSELASSYAAAWEDWSESEDASVWDLALGDGIA